VILSKNFSYNLRNLVGKQWRDRVGEIDDQDLPLIHDLAQSQWGFGLAYALRSAVFRMASVVHVNFLALGNQLFPTIGTKKEASVNMKVMENFLMVFA
jgi:hypothetical protein